MLASRRFLRIGSAPPIKTPLLLPSFSSKGFPNVAKILQTMEEYISDEVLVSAYDIYNNHIKPPFDFASAIFLDSGGYEASKEIELSDTYEKEYSGREWSLDRHQQVLAEWKSNSPTVCVSYDHPNDRVPTGQQIARAKAMVLPPGNSARALLIKPESETSKRLHLENILPTVKQMTGFAVVGVTEKEIGNSTLSRMINVAKLRKDLDVHHPGLPIHVFGSLDTISTFLYFLAGADIFDGLTWLRYAFSNGDTVYRHHFGALSLPITTNSDIVEGRCWTNNYQSMQEMRLSMIKFAADGRFEHFGKHHDSLKRAYDAMIAELGGA
jgi:hypothetical protein